MYTWYRQIHAPTGLEQCIYCNFTSEKEKNLVVTAASELTVYRLEKNVEVPGKNEGTEENTVVKQKLQQVGSWQLFGNVVRMKLIRLSGAKLDSVLLSFADAKLSIIEFDPAMHDIKTTSLHYFEDNLFKDGSLQRYTLPKIAVDPDSRCVCLQLTSRSLAIVPLRTSAMAHAGDDSMAHDNSTKRTAATSYTIDLHLVDSRLQRIIDIQFLYGYNEPTLLVLFESLRTWAGRVAMRQDTCNIVAISLNMMEQLHPVVWSLNGLPFDCKFAYPVPKPIGGVLIFAVNSLLYLNQSVPPYGTSLNSTTENSTSFPLKPQESVCMRLDCSCAVFISPESMVISLSNGDLYVLTLLVDSMRNVRNFHFDKAASSVLTSCLTVMEDGFIFLGSRLGNSLLLRYTEAHPESKVPSKQVGLCGMEEPAAKRKRLNTAADWAGITSHDIEDLEMYGKDTVTAEPLSSYKFEVCDSLLNIGPCGAAELGEPAYLSEEFVTQRETDLELAVLSGHGKNGALSVLQRTVKPQVVTTFELPGCTDMWTVHSPGKKKVGLLTTIQPLDQQHAYLILSKEDSTLLLETGKEIMEIEESGFNTREASVYVGNIGGDFILQVCASGVWLMSGVKLVQHIPLELGGPIVKCTICDPYAILLTADGQIVTLVLTPDPESEPGVKLDCSNPSITQVPQICHVCLYADTSGLFQANKHAQHVKMDVGTKGADPQNAVVSEKFHVVDEEEELLYGESDPDIIFAPEFTPKPEQPATHDEPSEGAREKGLKSFWLVIVRENRNLEIFEMPTLNLVYTVKNFSMGQKLLSDSGPMNSYSVQKESDKASTPRYDDNPNIHEILLVGLGHNSSKPHLIVSFTEDLLIYEVFEYSPPDKFQRSNSLRIRFKKVHHKMMIRRNLGAQEPGTYQSDSKNYLRRFTNIGGYSGVFLCGAYPHWIFMTVRGALRCHPMTVDGAISCFVPFHNVNCPNGFLYFNNQGELRICMLPPHMKYDALWPVRKISLRCSAHFLAYSIEHKVYAIVTSVSEPCTRLPYLNCDNEREFEDLDKGERFIYPHIDKFSVQLISPVSWELVPNARIDMDEFEHITCMRNVWLSSGADTSSRQNYLVIGTCNVFGEEMGSRGKIIILEVIEVVPEPGQPLTKNKLKQIYFEEQKGPVTAVCGLEGNLLAAIGQKIFIWKFDENQALRGLAFVDTNVYIHHALSFRSFAIVADMQRSITLLRYQTDFKTLSVTSRDIRPLEVYTSDLVVDGSGVNFLVSDHEKNLILFAYDPEDEPENHGGSRLTRRADMNIGSHANTMWRIAACGIDRSNGSAIQPYSGAHITMMGTLDGSICHVLPVAEKVYRRLLMLQNIMITSLQHIGGLNPKAFRHVRSQRYSLSNPMKNMLDGDLVWKFNSLSHLERHELCKKIGTSPEQILNDLMDIHRATSVM
uniref:Cleavage/polyadenylation specificity factor A subunit C-terminal domain-containing protein n=1 Tax=Ciona savignyi TaxID=51511 RepID=H2YEY2_CIOSA